MSTFVNAETEQETSRTGPGRRGDGDRRQRPTPLLSRFWLVGRRRGGRRAGEATDVYVDRYRASDWLLVGGVFVLSMLDLVFTLIHLRAGGREANPIMAWALQGGTETFSLLKLGVTTIGLFVLLLHMRFRRVRGLLMCMLVLYLGVMGWHLYLRSL